MGRHSRKRTKVENKNPQETEERRNSDSMPVNLLLLVDILLRLPAKSVARFVSVSKLFAELIRSEGFLTSFSLRSLKQKQAILLAFSEIDKEKGRENWFFFSLSSSSSSSPVFLHRMACRVPDIRYDPPYCINGLISFVYDQEKIISNPSSTGKSITLPLVKSRRSLLKRYFGYDPVDDHHKVLCITEPMLGTGMRVASNQCQVLTLRSSSHDHQNSWRKIECSTPHRPRSNGVCINGVLYYFAYMGRGMMELSLVRFQVRSEDFDFLTQLPGEVQDWVSTNPKLINYQGNVALVDRTNQTSVYTFGLWVLEDVEKQRWVKVNFSISHWKGKIRCHNLDIAGTTQTGEIIYTSYYVDDYYLVRHDRKMNGPKVVEIEENSEYKRGRFGGVVCFLDYVESVMFS